MVLLPQQLKWKERGGEERRGEPAAKNAARHRRSSRMTTTTTRGEEERCSLGGCIHQIIRWSPFSSPDAVDSTGGAGDNMVDCQLVPKKYSCNHSSPDLKFQKKFHRHGCSVSLQDLKQNRDALP